MMDRRQFAAGTLFSAIASPSLAHKPPACDDVSVRFWGERITPDGGEA